MTKLPASLLNSEIYCKKKTEIGKLHGINLTVVEMLDEQCFLRYFLSNNISRSALFRE